MQKGGIEEEVKSQHEAWRINFSDSTITYYRKGTLYSTFSNSDDPVVFETWKYIDSLVGSPYTFPTKDFLIGLDETGKGEVIGHTVQFLQVCFSLKKYSIRLNGRMGTPIFIIGI